jgi:HK97 family phage major capsid protein
MPETLEKPAQRQRIDGDLHRSLPATLTIRMPDPAESDQPADNLLRLRLSVSSEEPYLRSSWWDEPWIEVLGHKASEIQLDRLNGGAAVLANHDRVTAVGDTPLASIGVVEKAWIEGGRLLADIAISRREALADLRLDITDGLIRNVSIGYQIGERVLTKTNGDGQADEYRVTHWTPFEISLVDIPADATVGLGRQATEQDSPRYRVVDLPTPGAAGSLETKGYKMPEITTDPAPVTAPAATRSADIQLGADPLAGERERAREILAIGRAHNMGDLADKAIDAGTSLDAFRAMALQKLKDNGVLRPAESPELGMSKKDVEQYSFCRAMLAASDPVNAARLAPFEHECSRAAQDKRGDDKHFAGRDTAITIPVDVLSRGMSVHEQMAGSVARQLMQRAMSRAKAGGLDVSHAYRDLVVGTASAGGNLVATDLLGSSFIELLRNAMVLDQMGVTWLRDLNGNLAIPSQTGGATGYWLAESGAPTESAQTLGQMALTPKTMGAFTDYSRRLLLQSSIDVEMFVRADLAALLGQTLQIGAINGSGSSNEPTGLLNISGIGSVAGGTNGLAPTYANMVDLESAVANANADSGSLAYLTNTKARGTLRKTQEFATTNGKAVWTSAVGQRGVGDVLGYEAMTTNAVPSNLTKGTSGAVCSAIMFGNWADLVIGMWGGLDIMLDPYTGSTSGTRRVIALQDVDVNVRHAASFAAMKDALTP